MAAISNSAKRRFPDVFKIFIFTSIEFYRAEEYYLKQIHYNVGGHRQEQKQNPFGNDRQRGEGNSKGKGRSRFPSGMTDREAKATAKAREEADSLRE
jgi:hypothetical protein